MYSPVVKSARAAFDSGRTLPLEFRLSQLNGLLNLVLDNQAAIVSALFDDLRKPKQESITMEVEFVANEVRGCINNVTQWVADQGVTKNIVTMMDGTIIHPEPYGVVLIIGAWNYPIQLLLSVVGGAIAAGNCIVMKPSELAPATSKLITKLVPKYLDTRAYKVVEGGVVETTALLEERFDYIFYTGSERVGQIIRQASNKFLTPVTLELGGKSPVYIDNSVNIEFAVKRIIWAKCINLGQTCVAPDYLLCSPEVEKEFVATAKRFISEFYGEDPSKSDSLGRIVNQRNFDRLNDLLSSTSGSVTVGGVTDRDDLYISPTIVSGVKLEDSLMQSELFGPILPIINVSSEDEAIDLIKTKDKPLSAYVFTYNKGTEAAFKDRVSSGSMVFNDCIVHLSVDTLPFGGVGASGMGAYHGKYTFDTFSHQKSILIRDLGSVGEWLGSARYPPYQDWKINRLNFLVKNRKIPGCLRLVPHLLCFLAGSGSIFLTRYLARRFPCVQEALPEWF